MAVGIAGSDLGDDSNKMSVGGIAHVIGAGVSLALLIGVSVWGYQLITRDISGVPVVRAAEGPMRVQPDSPGGTVADHQGLSVNEIAAVGTASRPADRLILAPAPLDLSEEDVALASPPVEEPQETPVEQTSTAEAADAPKEELDAVQLAAVEALANALASGVDPINSTPTVPLDDTETAPADDPEGVAVSEEAQPIEEDVASAPVEGGLGRSLRPQVRPAGLGGLGALAQSPAIDTNDIDPESLPVGTRLAQLGAFA
ncbi:MAG: SPOR domain-containing protein, partial [Pseudomonadota bacterium]